MREKILPVLMLLACEYGAVLCCVLADLVSGIGKARRRGELCSSYGLRRTVDKISRYYLTLFGLSAVDAMIVASSLILGESAPFRPFPYLSTFGALCLALIEIKSILESADEKQEIRRTASELLKHFGIDR